MGRRLPDNIKLFLYRVSLHSGRVVENPIIVAAVESRKHCETQKDTLSFLQPAHQTFNVQAAFLPLHAVQRFPPFFHFSTNKEFFP